jgi:hypothetical protein
MEMIVVGDRKGPAEFLMNGCRFVPLDEQQELPFALARRLPTGHYSRKNLGYLLAMRQGAPFVYETDDDNAPLAAWRPRACATSSRLAAPREWVNVYRYFTDRPVWPRGLPLDVVRSAAANDVTASAAAERQAPIQQGLANGSPDVDAVWRLVFDESLVFADGFSIALPARSWCPFNSQSTWWWPDAWPLMYLPSYCSFRMTDIWRSFVAQRCLWAMGLEVVFHAAEVEQSRNNHDIMTDFEQEISGYTLNRKIARVLQSLRLRAGRENAGSNLLACYGTLVEEGILPVGELAVVEAWVDDCATAQARSGRQA